MSVVRRALWMPLCLLLGLAEGDAQAAEPGYYRHPAIHGDTVVFTAEGDLWTVAASGGAARRLTTHAAEESRAAISPDGRWLAFSATYEGPREVYVMPLSGGSPRRLSFDNGNAQVIGWSPDGKVIYANASEGGMTGSVIVAAVEPQSLARSVFPLAEANDAAIDPEGRWLYFIRYGLAMSGDNARGYRGGALGQLWRFDLRGGSEAERIGPRDANLRRPMWWNGRLLVIADIDNRDNLWSLALDGSDPQALTRHADFGIRSAQLHGDRVAYQLGADLHVLDLASATDSRLDIRLVSDFDQRRSRWIDDPLRYLDDVAFAPKGDRIALNARGRVTLAGLGALRRVDIGAAAQRLASPVLSPDGRWLYAISDASGEQEIWRFPADGAGTGEALTRDGGVRRWGLWLSPDGRHLAHDDKRGRLWLLDTESRRNRLVDEGGVDGNEGYEQVSWSADSRHLVFVRQTREVGRARLALFTLDDNHTQWLTSDRYHSHSPAFSPDGRWLWFLSDRDFRLANGSPWGDRNTGPFFDRRTKIYALALQPAQRFPFLPDDELSLSAADPGQGEGKADSKGSDKADLPALVREGLADRLFEVPLPGGNYRQLQAGKDKLYFLERDANSTALKSLPVANKGEAATQVEGRVVDYALSADGSKVFLRTAGNGDRDFGQFLIADTATKLPDDRSRITVRLQDWSLLIDPPAEWRQMFADAWRLHRDHFFDDRLRGVDWAAARSRFEPLLARVSDRHELADVLAQMMGELGALHSQVRGGDVRDARDGAQAGGLGARLEPVRDGLRIADILKGPPELPGERSPLQAPGVDIRVGDILTHVNGQSLSGARHVSDLLRNQGGRQVLLTLRRGGREHKAVVVATDRAAEERLHYSDWVERNRGKVEENGAGRIGYLHLYAMGPNDIATFAREFYAQFDRDGLIIDVRRNRGGNIDSWIIEKLLRRAWAFWKRPNGQPYTNMQQAFRGHLVVLTDAFTYSDGETFAAGVKSLGLAPLIGTRTAGAGIWLSARNMLVDRGIARVSEFPQYGVDGQWLIEAVGVEPDIDVDNLPHATFNGRDAQLEAGLDWLRRKLAEEPIPPLRPQAIPPLLGN